MTSSPEFLSPEWIAGLASRLATTDGGSTPTPLTIQYVIDTDEGAVEYHVELGPDGDTAGSGLAPSPDVTFRMDRATAKAISSGELSTEEAFITGRLDLEGDTTALIEAHRARGDA